MKLGNNELIRDMNSNLVLETIIEKQPISRAALSKELGLTKATISAIVLELMNKKLVQEIGSEDTSLGRKPILLTMDKKCGYVISIDIEVSTISAMVTDLLGEDCYVKQIAFPKKSSDFLPTLISFIDSLKTPANTPYGLIGITLGIHGVTHHDDIVFTPNYHLAGLDLKSSLEEYYHVPIHIENEANLSVLGEEAFAYDYDNIANLSVHSGIGMGLMMHHKLYTGHSGYAGEFGHTIIETNGKPCPCGNKGCLEQYLTEHSILTAMAERKKKSSFQASEFIALYDNKDKDALQVMEDFIYYMSICINNIVNTYNPDIIIINCSIINERPTVIDLINQELNPRIRERVELVPSKLKDNSILLGGVIIAVKDFLGIKRLKLKHEQIL